RSFDLEAGSFALEARDFDLKPRSFDLEAGSFDLEARSFDVESRSFDLEAGSFDLGARSLEWHTFASHSERSVVPAFEGRHAVEEPRGTCRSEFVRGSSTAFRLQSQPELRSE